MGSFVSGLSWRKVLGGDGGGGVQVLDGMDELAAFSVTFCSTVGALGVSGGGKVAGCVDSGSDSFTFLQFQSLNTNLLQFGNSIPFSMTKSHEGFYIFTKEC